MIRRPSVLCPIDFSVASRGALRYALAIAEHFGAGLTLVTVNDPLMADATEVKLGAAHLSARVDVDEHVGVVGEVAQDAGDHLPNAQGANGLRRTPDPWRGRLTRDAGRGFS